MISLTRAARFAKVRCVGSGIMSRRGCRRSIRYFSTSGDKSARRGGIFIGLGWSLLGLVALDQLLQYRQAADLEERRKMLGLMQQQANEENHPSWDANLPPLYRCKITHVEHSLDGTKILKNVKIGDVVEVLEANIGPGKSYHLCRHENLSNAEKVSIGWSPIESMEEMD